MCTSGSFNNSLCSAPSALSQPNSVDPDHEGSERIKLLHALSFYGGLATDARASPRSTPIVRMVLKNCIIRIIRAWINHGNYVLKVLVDLNNKIRFNDMFSLAELKDNESIFVLVVRELLQANRGNDDEPEFYFLHAFLTVFVCKKNEYDDKILIVHYMRKATMHVYAGFVLNQDILCIKRWLNFLYLIEAPKRKIQEEEVAEEEGIPPDQQRLSDVPFKDYGEEIGAENLHYITAKVLVRFEKGPIVFLLRDVLKNTKTLEGIIKKHSRSILKLLIEEFGQDGDTDYVLERIKYAAIWHDYRSKSKASGCVRSLSGTAGSSIRPLEGVETMTSMNKDESGENSTNGGKASSSWKASLEDKEDAAKLWVKTNIMFLLYDTMINYRNKSNDKKIQVMKSIKGIIHFLRAKEAALYMPKIMSSVNIGLSDSSNNPELRYCALRNLSTFIKVVCEDFIPANMEAVGRSLSTITVALLPIFEPGDESGDWSVDTVNLDNVDDEDGTDDVSFQRKCIFEAISLLHFLVSGEVGEQLKSHLSNLPFFPSHPRLSAVKKIMRDSGIDLDDLSQYNKKASDEKSDIDDKLERKFQIVLHRRLEMISSLLSHENINVRKAVADQLTTLVMNNRRLLKKLIDSEESASARFLTETTCEEDKGGVGGVIGTLMRALLHRCARERSHGVKNSLAVALGAVGAIDPNKLSMETVSSEEVGETKASSDMPWYFNQPPWRSSMVRCSCRLA